MSVTNELLPEPLTPVTTVKHSSGIFTLIFFRLCWRAPDILMTDDMKNKHKQPAPFSSASCTFKTKVNSSGPTGPHIMPRWSRPKDEDSDETSCDPLLPSGSHPSWQLYPTRRSQRSMQSWPHPCYRSLMRSKTFFHEFLKET